jgi:hypothetical protein
VEERSNEAPALSPVEACLLASLFAGEFAHVVESEPRLLRGAEEEGAALRAPNRRSRSL